MDADSHFKPDNIEIEINVQRAVDLKLPVGLDEALDHDPESVEEVDFQIIERDAEDAVLEGDRHFGLNLEDDRNFDGSLDPDLETECRHAEVFGVVRLVLIWNRPAP